MPAEVIEIDGVRVPRFLYGTAWKEDETCWDRQVREFCTTHNITYQGFSLLTANRAALGRPAMAEIAKRHGRTVSQIVFRFGLDVGMIPLTGTTDANHMREDLEVFDFRLDPDEVDRIERVV